MRENIELDENGSIIDLGSFFDNVQIEIDTEMDELIADAEDGKIDGAICTLYYKEKMAATIWLPPAGFAKLYIHEGFERYEKAFKDELENIVDFLHIEEFREEMYKYNQSLELS